eukprot:CAMPEP_0116027498 /NCGR_PEP_ID=MMETSP0321-20121206/14691_1 /TAXON_ID=163516 /ORGANISM="Leptocylindrus danicus var. danicus, Strain B650" /LENGTH=370 /DNA_ID=CAMNT_0003500917 /DNA_START=1840 /DNA_END=2949 /DNA_ORIENTATION=+
MRAARSTTYFAALLSSSNPSSCFTTSFSPQQHTTLSFAFPKPTSFTTIITNNPSITTISKRQYHSNCQRRRMHRNNNNFQQHSNIYTTTTYRGRALFATTAQSFDWNHVPSIGSTQDEAKRKLSEDSTADNSSNFRFAISASEQTLGRGTNGRTWVSNQGNVYLTVALPWDSLPVPVTLLPLKVGCIIVQNVKQILSKSNAKVTLKWPNDVLINEQKVAGVLIEIGSDAQDNNYFLVGIGINVVSAPEVPTSGAQRGRKATYIRQHMDDDNTDDEAMISLSEDLARNVATQLFQWIDEHDTHNSINANDISAQLIQEWKQHVDNWGKKLIMRDDADGDFATVVPIDVEMDGQLRVRDRFGNEKLLCADYL